MRHAAPHHRSETRLGMRRPQVSAGRHAAGAAGLDGSVLDAPSLDAPTEVLEAVVSTPAVGRPSRLEKFVHRLPVSGGVVAAVVGLAVTQAVCGAVEDASTHPTTTSSSSSSTSNGYLGTTPLGCDVYDASAGSASRVTMTSPYCTQQALAERMCDLTIDDDPQVGYATPNTWALWRGSAAGDVEDYSLGASGQHQFLCANFATGQAGTVTMTSEEWKDLITVGDTVPARIAATIAPRTPVRTYG
ncbi:hypothetical protein [Actinomycetospora sp. TBRC 11914]|uniref:hypothetical protein n=1 Tax=Actinomycetospora sp. TBRC 11914 TaxID=2729387 RepID=UPI00145EA55B|nr:hypothetical protein [Actinomycetospora sp. TBRC 11914]NMO93232.1 hypothetical protein [Actinomycetospora sp. TBRC 11914]